jgi:hypothetical protein
MGRKQKAPFSQPIELSFHLAERCQPVYVRFCLHGVAVFFPFDVYINQGVGSVVFACFWFKRDNAAFHASSSFESLERMAELAQQEVFVVY